MDLTRRALLTGAIGLGLGCRRGVRPRGAARIVSLAPTATEVLFALGAGARVVGVSAGCDAPDAATRLPRVGSMVAPNYEAIRALRADAVAAVEGPIALDVVERLRRDGVRVVTPRVQTVDDLRRAVDAYAALHDDAGAADRFRRAIDDGFARVARAVAGRPRPRTVAVYSADPLVVGGRGAWIDDLIARAGGDNAVQASGQFPLVSVEQVMSWVPSVILDFTTNGRPLAEAWAELTAMPAVAARRVHRIEDARLRRPGPRVVETVTRVAALLHPGVAL
jgi:ABC-type hemin transport system substrate-binding protein